MRWASLILQVFALLCFGAAPVVLEEASSNAACYHSDGVPVRCVPPSESFSLGRLAVTNSTCGTPPNVFCFRTVSRETQSILHDCTGICDAAVASNAHSPQFLTDFLLNEESWWQSENNMNTEHTVVIDLSLGALVEISVISFNFVSLKPSAFKILKSDDFGDSYSLFHLFSTSCLDIYEVSPDQLLDITNETAVLCQQVTVPPGPGQISFLPELGRPSANDSSPGYSEDLYNFITASNISVVLQQHFAIDSRPMDDPGYYYAIEDFNVIGSCQCHGHAFRCQRNIDDTYQCVCQHNTSGRFCERCSDFYQNVPWQRADGSGPFECVECNCNNHSNTCVFDEAVYEMSGRTSGGVCTNCSDNTQGLHCESCSPLHYPQPELLFTNPNICLPCNCDMRGIRDSGDCAQESLSEIGMNAGDCFCKANVGGRNCDQCIAGFFNLSSDNPNGCEDCLCNETGSISASCNQTSGACFCKPNVSGSKCDFCTSGFYNPDPTSPSGCIPCNCNPGGAVNEQCDSFSGQCVCKSGVTGTTCSDTLPGYFFPEIDILRLEGENAMGFPSYIIRTDAENTLYTGTGFYEVIEGNGNVTFGTITPPVGGTYEVLFRYNLIDAMLWESAVLVIETDVQNIEPLLCDASEFSSPLFVTFTNWIMGVGVSISETVCLQGGQEYTFTLTGLNSGLNVSVSLEIDSLVLIPINSSELVVFSNAQLYLEYADCINSWRSVQTKASARASCAEITFTFSTAIYGGALECLCDIEGTVPGTVCNQFGGQCACLPDVRGRQCDQCTPRFYNLTANGCSSCNCSSVGSQNDICDPSDGACQCSDNVVGQDCSTCARNHWGLDPQRGCIPCNCNATGSVSLQCNQQNATCQCHPGVMGPFCDTCQELYFGFSQNGCSECNCNEVGSTSEVCETINGQCVCLTNTRGRKCNECATGTFNLQEENPLGCQPCFCSGLSTTCTAADNYMAGTVETVFGINDANPLQGWTIFPGEYSFQVRPVFNGIHVTANTSAFLVAPVEFLGKKLSSYTQYLTVTYTALNQTSTSPTLSVTLSGNGLQADAQFDQSTTSFGITSLAAQLHEVFGWVHSQSNQPVTSFDLQLILSNLDNISILLTLDSDIILHSISLDTALPSEANATLVSWVEQCACLENYTGLSCDQCAEGFTRSESGLCELCQCNGFSETCDAVTGVCTNCSMFTTGVSCEQCIQGTFGDPLQDIECLPCPCPASEGFGQFSRECELQTSGDVMCLNCPQGHIGQRCEECEEGYFGDPSGSVSGVPTMCADCRCNGNVDINTSGSCDTVTGVCLLCLNNTGGNQCERCADGFYGDAILAKNCTGCNCSMNGSNMNLTCNYTTGQCICLPNVVGLQCDECAPNHYGLRTGSGCLPCNCHPNGAEDAQCLEDGQCVCRLGVTGLFCDQCLPGFFGLSSNGCEECACSPINSINQECSSDGVCICQPAAAGDKCEECIRNHFQTGTGCTVCSQCYQELENEYNRINGTKSNTAAWLYQLTTNISSELTPFDPRLLLQQDALQQLLQMVNKMNDMEDVLVGQFESISAQVLNVLPIRLVLLDLSLNFLKRISTPVFVLASTSEELMNRTIEEFEVTMSFLSSVDAVVLPAIQRVVTSINDSFIQGNMTTQSLLSQYSHLSDQVNDIRALVADVVTHGEESLRTTDQLYSLHVGTLNTTDGLSQSLDAAQNSVANLLLSLEIYSMNYSLALQNLMGLASLNDLSSATLDNLLSLSSVAANNARDIISGADQLRRRLISINESSNDYQRQLQILYEQSIEHLQNATTTRQISEDIIALSSVVLSQVQGITENADLALQDLLNYSNGSLTVLQSVTAAIEAVNSTEQAANIATDTLMFIQSTTMNISRSISAVNGSSLEANERLQQLEQDSTIDIQDIQVTLASNLEASNTSLEVILSLSSEANILANEHDVQQAHIDQAETLLPFSTTLNTLSEQLTTTTEAELEELSMSFINLDITSSERLNEIWQSIQSLHNSLDINMFYNFLRDTLSRQKTKRRQLENELQLLKQEVSYFRHISLSIPDCGT